MFRPFWRDDIRAALRTIVTRLHSMPSTLTAWGKCTRIGPE